MAKMDGQQLSIAWKRWVESPDAAPCLVAATLGTVEPDTFLRNRLWHAFMAGAAAATAQAGAMPDAQGGAT